MSEFLKNKSAADDLLSPKKIDKRIRDKEIKAAEKERQRIEKEKMFVNLYCKINKDTHEKLREMSFKTKKEMYIIVNKALEQYFENND